MGDEYSFLQEKIKDEAGSPQRFKKKVIRMIILGLIFGIIACFTFFASKPWIEELLGQDKEEITIPEDEEIPEDDVQNEEIDETAQAEAEEKQQIKYLKSLQNTAKKVMPTIVTVSGKKSLGEEDSFLTAGVIIADNGAELLVLSQTLSEDKLKNINITFADEKQYSAVEKKKDQNTGIMICAVSKEQFDKNAWKQPENVILGNSLRVKAGDPVILIGKTKQAETVISYGFVASNEEKTRISDGTISLLRADVAGAEFESGMIFNQEGDMIGLINETIDDSKMLITAYSISDIKNEIEHLSNEKSVPYIGICGVDLPEELKEEGLESGIWVEEIDTDSPVMKAGIQRGDVITQMADTTIYNMKDYRNVLLKQQVKKEIVLKGFRKGADDQYVEMEFRVIVGQK